MTSSRTLKALEPHMFSLDAMQLLSTSKTPVPTAGTVVAPVDKPLRTARRGGDSAPGLWTPTSTKDRLFWCFYYVWKGDHGYAEAREHAFRIEKETKINAVEELRAKADDVKRYGLKLTDVESELVAAKRITYKGLCGLCVAFGIRIVYVRGRTYIDIAPGDECAGLIITRDGTTGVKKSPVGETIPCAAELEALVNDLYFIQDPSKPIRAISAYSLSDLTLIAKKLDVALTDDGGKRKLKKRLYEDITANL
tara:strand:- start:827 stop:1582 length:756 start_codon:yes stop_codon:yes gene_type:complete